MSLLSILSVKPSTAAINCVPPANCVGWLCGLEGGDGVVEDFEGDASFGRNTLPVYFDVNVAKIVVCCVLMLTVGVLAVALTKHLQSQPTLDVLTLVYCLVLLVMPIFATIVVLMFAKQKKQYHTASIMCKLIMLMGIAYTLVINFGL